MIDDLSILVSTIMCVVIIWRARILDARRRPDPVAGEAGADPEAIFRAPAAGDP